MRRHPKYLNVLISALCLIVAALILAAPASAEVTVEGTGEPAFTNSTNNTQWIRWQAPSGSDDYRLHARYYRNNVQISEVTWPVPATGTAWLDWSGVATLEEGNTYAICVVGEFSFPNDSLFFTDGANSCTNGANEGKRTSTTIDRTKPTTSLVAAGGAAVTKQASIPVSIGFQDTTAGPFPATFMCVKAGAGPCDSGFTHSAGCSVPAGPGKSTSFNCNVDASQLPDGPVTVCVIAADASVPNKPSSADQTGSANQANHSDSKCDTVVLDRQGPTLGAIASKTVMLTGEQVAFSATATDSVAGLDASKSRWEFGDGTPASAGTSVSHSFAQPGTYVVMFRAEDQAGNGSLVQKTVTVNAPPTSNPTTPTTPSNPTTPSVPGPSVPAPNGPATADGRLASVQIGDVTVLVPKRVRLSKVRQLVLGTRTDQAGKLTLLLTRGKKVYSRLAIRLATGESSQRLRLPRRLKAGTYAVKIAFTPTGASWSAAGTARVAFKR
jgi:hypothetical protein